MGEIDKMKNKIFEFTRFRYIAPFFSLAVIIVFLSLTAVKGGFNLGIDFLSGLNIRVQIAPEAFIINYTGDKAASVNVYSQQMVITEGDDFSKESFTFAFSEYDTVKKLIDGISSLKGFEVISNGYEEASASDIIGLNYSMNIKEEGIVINILDKKSSSHVDISELRAALAPVGTSQIQVAGDPSDQEFIVRVREIGEQSGVAISDNVNKLLQDKFGANNVIIKQSDFSGPRFSKTLSFQAIYLICFSMALMLIYIWFRFKLAYAVSSILALVHDALVMVGTIGFLQLEVDVTTIAAVLTIIGYSLNATIVIFDRVKENIILLKDKPIKLILNTSISQSLSRGVITSFTTLIAVIAIYIFGIGVIKNFAFNLIVGICVGTYSSFFIAPSLLYIWMAKVQKKKFSKIMILKERPAVAAVAAADAGDVPAPEISSDTEKEKEISVAPDKKSSPETAAVLKKQVFKGTRKERRRQSKKEKK